mgnify:CR=1 FL=1
MSLHLDASGALEFPCHYPVKALTHAGESATEQVLNAVADAGMQPARERVTIRPSRNGRFQSITMEIHARSRDELENVYARLRQLDVVVMTL